jgi:hypothetical protein
VFPWFGPSKYVFVHPKVRLCTCLSGSRSLVLVKETDRENAYGKVFFEFGRETILTGTNSKLFPYVCSNSSRLCLERPPGDQIARSPGSAAVRWGDQPSTRVNVPRTNNQENKERAADSVIPRKLPSPASAAPLPALYSVAGEPAVASPEKHVVPSLMQQPSLLLHLPHPGTPVLLLRRPRPPPEKPACVVDATSACGGCSKDGARW